MSRSIEPKAHRLRLRTASMVLACGLAATGLVACRNASASRQEWQEDFNLADRTLTHTGESTYFILRPGFQSVLTNNGTTLTITVLDETKEINGVQTRVVEEREERGGQLAEVARNFFAIDEQTGDVFYFGEEVDNYAGGSLVNHSGTWLAEDGNRPGLIMPGSPGVGMKYFQELAPDVAMDRAEVISTSARCSTPAGEFDNCLITHETSPLEPGVVEQKTYAPGVGLVQDQSLRLVTYGPTE